MNVIQVLEDFYKNFDGKKGVIGKTERGKDIPFFFVGEEKPPIIIAQYAIHAREYITTYLAIEQIKYMQKQSFFGGVYFLPMINIDGVTDVLNGERYKKSNANLVDLNVNFDAKWGKGEFNQNFKGLANYIGPYPFSEKETVALRDFTLFIKPNMTVSYHSKGEEIYFQFNQRGRRLIRDERLAQAVAEETGYKIKRTKNSVGGYKDWCVSKLKIPAITIEVGEDSLSHPIEKKRLKDISRKNLNTLQRLLKELSK